MAERYGSETKEGISYTEAEYDYAREKGVPVAAFLLHEDARKAWRMEKAEFIDSPKKVDALRQKCQGLMVRYWKNKGDLESACVKSLSHMFTAFPRNGWVPAQAAANSDFSSELARISRENEELKSKIDNLEQQFENAIESSSGTIVGRAVANYLTPIISSIL